MADRAAIADVAHLLRDARDRLEQLNDPFDHRLGSIHAHIALVLNDLRSVPITPPVPIGNVI